MPGNEPNTLDKYERLVGEKVGAWSPPQRLAFVAALAERWLGAYEKFSAAEGWGDPAVLRQVVGAIWDHLRGRPLSPADRARFAEQVRDNAPNTETFDTRPAWKALQACLLLGQALECCEEPENPGIAVKAAIAGFEAVGDWPSDPAGGRRAWQRVAAREELAQQSTLLEKVGAITRFDDQTVATLRSGLGPKGQHGGGRKPRAQGKKKRVDDDSIDGWRGAVSGYLKKSAEHRIAFAAALAERLFPVYQTFAARARKGGPEPLRAVLDAVWQAARGRPIDPAALPDLRAKLHLGAPGKEEADAWGAWSAWRVLELALECCGSTRNTEAAEEAAVVAYERVAGPDARKDPRIWKGQLRRPEIYNEIIKQMMMLARLHALPALDDQSVEALRRMAQPPATPP
jgi:uncharacterized protein YjaG (DUF416 family)